MAVLRLDGDARGAIRATEDVRKGMAKVAEETEKVEGKTKDAGKAQEESFGANAMRHIGTYITGLVGVEKAIELIVWGFQEIDREGKKAADNVTRSLGQVGQLLLVSQTPQDLARSIAQSQELVTRGIVPAENLGQAYTITAAMQRAGLTPQERSAVMQLGQQKRLQAEDMAGFIFDVQGYRESFPGTGSFADVAAKLMAASGISRQGPSEVAQAAMKYGPQAIEAGLTDVQALAAATVIARTSPNQRLAATRAQQYFVEGEPFTGPQAELYARTLTQIAGAPARGLPGGLIESDPGLAAAELREQLGGQYGMTWQRTAATKEQLWQAYNTMRKSFMLQRGAQAGAVIEDWLNWIPDIFNVEENLFRQMAVAPQHFPGLEDSPELLKQIRDHVRDTSRKTRAAPAPSGRQE